MAHRSRQSLIPPPPVTLTQQFLSFCGRDDIANSLPGSNDGDLIPEETYIEIADLLRDHVSGFYDPEVAKSDHDWLLSHEPFFRHCGGFRCF